MKKVKYFALALLLTGGFAMTSCSDDDVATTQVTVGLNISNTIGDDLTVKTGTFTFTDISTGLETKIDYSSTLTRAAAESTLATLADGLYNVTFIGTATYTYTETQVVENEAGEEVTTEVTKTAEVNVQGAKQNVEVKGGAVSLDLTTYVQNQDEAGNFVIAEIFSAGTINSETNKQYNGDQYIRIHNNSAETLYADGLIILESKFLTVTKWDYTPNIMDEAMTVQVIAMVPGSGKDYPVLPGESITICDNAMNHKEANPGSADLSNANFEWYTQSTSTSNPDIDNPDVPNLEMMYNYTKTVWVLAKQGNRSYAIGRLPEGMTSKQYLADYKYEYTYTLTTGNQSKVFDEYKFPNSWIIDAVNMSPKTSMYGT